MKYTCPCCGYVVFNSPPGSYDICPICFWEDDVAQLKFPKTTGANKASLIEAQRNYREFGASEKRLLENVRKPKQDEIRDKTWRPIDTAKDAVEEPIPGKDYGASYPEDGTDLYYWRK